MTRISMIGAGNVGGNLGVRFSKAKIPVRFGVRDNTDVGELLARAGDHAAALGQAEAAAWAEVIFVALPGAVAAEVVGGLGDLGGKIIVDCTNPIRMDRGPVWTPPGAGSNAAAIALAAPGARVVKGFNTFGAELHQNPLLSAGPVDVQLAGDDAEAKNIVSTLATQAGFTPIDAGPLRNAALLENLAVLWIHLAMFGGQGREVAFKLLGR